MPNSDTAVVLDAKTADVIALLVDDLTLLAGWRKLRGAAGKSLLSVEIEDGAPPELEDLAARISALTAADLPDAVGPADAIAELEEIFTALDEREQFVLRERFLAPEPKTLAELGSEFGVTRERARQIEVKVKRHLEGRFGFGTAVGNLLASLRVEIQPVAALDRLIEQHPEIAVPVPSVGVPLWLVLDRLDDYFEVTDGWAAAPGVAEAKAQTRALLEEFESPNGVVELVVLAESSALSRDELVRWLTWCGYALLGGRILTRVRNTGDHAAAILEVLGEPTPLDELVTAMASGRNPRSVANVLGGDDRFVRSDRATWALADWGVEEYTTIRNLIARELDAHDGEMPLSELVAQVAGKFDVSASSVQTYAASGDFEVRQGNVRRRSTRGVPQKTPEQTRRLYRHGDIWRLSVKVTSEHLRGSGFTVPAALAGIAGCGYGEVVEYESRLGTHAIRWKNLQPASGSVRRFLEDLGVGEGEYVFLEFHSDRRFDVRRAFVAEPTVAPLRRALAAVGRPDANSVPDGEVVLALAEAIGRAGEDRPRRVLSGFRARGEEEIVELLEQAWVPAG